jgi:asparagine synthase (glutamine-hydrolysing)
MLLSHWYGTQRGERFRERAYLASYRRAYEAIAELFRPELLEQVDPERDLEAVLRPYFQAAKPASLLNKLMALNIRLKGAHLILPKVERMTAAFGLTPLSPLFDEELIRLSFQMPPRLKLREGVEKWVLKRAYEADLPKEVIERPKSGMRVPVHAWFRGYLWGRPGEMRPYAAKILSDKAVRRAGWFRPQAVRELWRYRSDSGPGRFGLRLWMLMTIELWRRVVLQGRPPTDGSAPSRRAGLSSAPSRPSSRPGEAQPPRAATTS